MKKTEPSTSNSGNLGDAAKDAKRTWPDFGEGVKKAREVLTRTTTVAVEKTTEAAKVLAKTGKDGFEKGREAASTTKGRLDDLTKHLPIKELRHIAGNQPLYAVLDQMTLAELTTLYTGPLCMRSPKDIDTADNASDDGLRNYVAAELQSAAKNSLMMWQALPSYDDVVRQVAQRIDVSQAAQADIADVERAILFKIVDLSISKMTDAQKLTLTSQVEAELAAGGIHRKVMIDEVKQFAVSMGKSAGKAHGLAGGAGLAGTVLGVNALQLIVLKGIVATSGYVAAGQAWLGFGALGGLMELLEEPALIVLFLGPMAVNAIAGPAFRKLVPAICVIAAKRIETSAVPIEIRIPTKEEVT
jgi:uncharacterized protein YaaW (UPF0174 family)